MDMPQDYLKEDSCGGTTHGTVWEQYAKMRDALNKTVGNIKHTCFHVF